ncbi:MAG: hypothetical protein KF768_14000 [Phycisphaeraceae bacterium]|nr:hypothetical protein [Phycisphaeraceae bacterium]
MPPTRLTILLLLLLTGLTLPACRTRFDDTRDTLALLHAQGRYDQAAALLDTQEALADYGQKNRLLWWLERGAVAVALDDYPFSIETLNKADDFMEIEREQTSAERLATWFINDTESPYYGAAYEDMYVNVLKLVAHLRRGVLDNGAEVEARRLANKSDHLRRRYVRELESLRNDRDYAAATAALGRRIEVVDQGEFIESPLGTFLSCVTFLKSNNVNFQRVAAQRLRTAITLQRALQTRVDPANFEGLESLSPDDVNVLFIAISGRGPTKVPERIGPIPIYTYTVYFELPRLVYGPAEAAAARAVVRLPGESQSILTTDLPLVEDLRVVAEDNFRRQLPAITIRTLIRSSAKAAAVTIATEEARKRGGSQDTKTGIELAGILGGILLLTLTEKADLRSWTFLPGQAHVGLSRLEPGEYEARIEYLSASGSTLHTGPWQPLTVRPGARSLSTTVEYWWR